MVIARPGIVRCAFVALSACGSAQVAPAPPVAESGTTPAPSVPVASAAPNAETAAPPASTASLPKACASSAADLCTPAADFVNRLCVKPHQEVALALFAKSSPFTRLYLRGRVDELGFDEEVLALRVHEQKKGRMIVGSGNGTYDVLRWDGSCAMGVEAEAFTHSRPPSPRAAHVQWHRIGESMQEALIKASDVVRRAHARRGKECKGAMTGDVPAACQKADAALVEAIVGYVRQDGTLPDPQGL